MKSNAAWFAIGALTCAGCFMLGGIRQKDPPKVLRVDEIEVKHSIRVGDATGPHWKLFCEEGSMGPEARLTGRAGKSKVTLTLLDSMTGFAMNLDGETDDDFQVIRLNLLAPEFAARVSGMPTTSIGMIDSGQVNEIRHEGGSELVFKSEPYR